MSLHYGKRAKNLLLQLQRSDWLPVYDDDGLKSIIEEVNMLNKEIKDTIASDGFDIKNSSLACGLMVHHQCLIRNKRCILAYLQNRLERIKRVRWETGSLIPNELKHILGSKELDFFKEYDKLVGQYIQGFNLDLTADIQPPKDLYIEVRVLNDCGEILTDTGSVHLESGTVHYLRRSDVEHLVRQGHLEQI